MDDLNQLHHSQQQFTCPSMVQTSLLSFGSELSLDEKQQIQDEQQLQHKDLHQPVHQQHHLIGTPYDAIGSSLKEQFLFEMDFARVWS